MSGEPNLPRNDEHDAALIEAVLVAGGPPLDAARMVELVGASDERPVIEAVAQLNQHYFRQGRPYEIRRLPAGFQMVLRPEFAPIARRLRGRSREVRLSVAAIEVLSIIAYRQPINLQAIDSIRGVDSAAIVRQLRRRNLVESVDLPGAEPRTGQYRTTRRFLELFHLATLDDLPRVQELERA